MLPHLQVLLLPGEGVRESLCGLGSVLCHLGLDGVRDLLEHGVDLSQEAPGLVNVIQLQGRWGVSASSAEPPPSPSILRRSQNRGPSAPAAPTLQMNPVSSESEESPPKAHIL